MDGPCVSLDQLELDEEDLYINAAYQGKPFTGTACGEEGQETYEIPYIDGMAHGRCVWHWKKSGKLSTEEYVDHGTVIKGTFWYPPGDVIHRQKDETGIRYYYRDGTLAIERTETCTREYYPSGALKNERTTTPEGTRYAWYGEDGTWAVRWRQGPKDPNRRLPPEPEKEYNDGYIRLNFLKLLETTDFASHFMDWLKQRYKLTDSVAHVPPEAERMICLMIACDDLRVKHRGIVLAGQWRIEEARPYLKQALQVTETPPGETSVTGGGHSYAWPICENARRALLQLGKE